MAVSPVGGTSQPEKPEGPSRLSASGAVPPALPSDRFDSGAGVALEPQPPALQEMPPVEPFSIAPAGERTADDAGPTGNAAVLMKMPEIDFSGLENLPRSGPPVDLQA